MTLRKILAGLAVMAAISTGGAALAEVSCGANTGTPADGAPIVAGGTYSNSAPGDRSSATDAAAAYFACVNANGGINGRPIDYRVEDDQ